MALFDVKKLILSAGVALVMLLAADANANAQSSRQIERERQRIEPDNARYQRERQERYRSDQNSSGVTRRTEQRVNNASYSNGYEQGLVAGEFDGRKRKYNRSNVYRDSGAYPDQGDPTSSDYIYRQGYLHGYNDGYNSIRNY
ncbi:MAG: hypothetical protein ABJB34_06080 [Acidobacteriota bacterium]